MESGGETKGYRLENTEDNYEAENQHKESGLRGVRGGSGGRRGESTQAAQTLESSCNAIPNEGSFFSRGE